MSSKKTSLSRFFPFCWRDLWVTAAIFSCAAVICFILQHANSVDGFASPVFVLAVLCVSRFTTGYLFGFITSVLGVICVNFVFTYPYWKVDFALTGYPLTFLAFLAASIMTSALTTQVRQQERLHAESEKEKMRANLLRSVSHDIRTPLTSIIGSTSAILENPDLTVAEQHELLEDVRSEAQWLIRIVENLLSITRIGADSTHIAKETEAAEEVLGETVRKFRRRYPTIAVNVTVPDELLMVPMDPILIEQVLNNLLENAVLHGKTTSQIHIRLYAQNHYAYFSVKDDGQGIPEKELPTLFDGTLKHSETVSGDRKRNMGLGLSVCLAIVRAHGGTMSAKNHTTGSEFTFCLPLEHKEELS